MARRIWSVLSLAVCTLLLIACSGDDYLNAIPRESTALMAIDVGEVARERGMANQEQVLRELLQVDDVADCGIDLGNKIYLFETVEGDFGLCAKVKSQGDLEKWVHQLARKGLCRELTERKGYHFTLLNDAWLVGFSEETMMVMGPIVIDAQVERQQRMSRYLGNSEEEGVKSSPLFERLDTIQAPMAMVARAHALPDDLAAPFTLGAPKGADASQVVIEARMDIDQGWLNIEGKTFSFNKEVDASLKAAAGVFRPIGDSYVASMSSDALMGMFVNVVGKQFLPLLQGNEALQVLLTGINTAVDMDNIIRSVDGDMLITIRSFSEEDLHLVMAAKLAHSQWLSDVGYWKQSCPEGSRIIDCGKDSYCFTNGHTSFFSGVSDDMQFYGGSDEPSARAAILPAARPLAEGLRQRVIGKKMALVLNLEKVGQQQEEVSALTGMLKPFFGDLKAIVFSSR